MQPNEPGIRKNLDGFGPETLPQDQLMADLRAVVSDAEALLKATANQGGEKLDELRAKARESLRAANQHLSDGRAEAVLRTRQAVKATDEYVHTHPWAAIAAAGSIGLLLGALLRRS